MSTRKRVTLTVAIAVLWLFWFLPFTVAGVFNMVQFIVAAVLTLAAVVVIWNPWRHGTR